MKKYLLILALFFPLLVSGQGLLSGVVGSIPALVGGDGEMLTNGAFTSGTSWTVTGGWTLTSNTAVYNKATNGTLYQTNAQMASSIVANTSYTLTFDLTGTSGAGIYMRLGSYDEGSGGVYYNAGTEETNGSKTIIFTTPADIYSGGLVVLAYAVGDSGGTIDNLSLKITP